MGAQGALPVDAAGNPWLGSYVYNSGNLVLDLLYNLMLESTGRLQKCRLYEMTSNKTARSTISYLIVRDQAHENAFAKALETLGVNWRTALPIPKTNAEQFPEVKKLLDQGLQSKQFSFDLTAASEAGKIFQGLSPSKDGTQLDASQQAPEGVPLTISPERPEEFSPGADKDLRAADRGDRGHGDGRHRRDLRGDEVARHGHPQHRALAFTQTPPIWQGGSTDAGPRVSMSTKSRSNGRLSKGAPCPRVMDRSQPRGLKSPLRPRARWMQPSRKPPA